VSGVGNGVDEHINNWKNGNTDREKRGGHTEYVSEIKILGGSNNRKLKWPRRN
jgi:hypothetical protein